MKIESKNNYKIPIKEFKPNKIEKIIIACHGFGGDKESSAIELLGQELIKENIMVIAFDFPAHGESNAKGKEYLVHNCINDLITIEEYITKKYPEKPIGIFATSFGAYITLLKINQYSNNYFSIVLRAPAICMDKIFENSILRENISNFKKRGYTVLGYEKELIVSYNFYEELKNNKLFEKYNKNEELLIIQGTEDNMAPIDDSIRFIQEKNPKGKIEKIIGADHRMKKEGELEKAIDIAVEYINGKKNYHGKN